MARKNTLKGLMDQAAQTKKGADNAPASAPPRYAKGAIGAVSRSIADLKSRSLVDLDPFSIKSGGLHDRLDVDQAAHDQLMESIRLYGQQVPVLVRPDPDEDGVYRIVYGRRRVLALQDLKLPVKAMIRELDEREAILAQGQENAARRDLSFIERVNFARQMDEAGYDRKIIGDALATDKTLISRMLQVAEAVPLGLIEAIGAAPGIGRDRWLKFAGLWSEQELEEEDGTTMLAAYALPESDGRFDALLSWLETRNSGQAKSAPAAQKPRARRTDLRTPEGKRFGRFERRGEKGLRIDIESAASGGFDLWLEENIETIHRDWLNKHGD